LIFPVAGHREESQCLLLFIQAKKFIAAIGGFFWTKVKQRKHHLFPDAKYFNQLKYSGLQTLSYA